VGSLRCQTLCRLLDMFCIYGQGTICPHVQTDGVLSVGVFKSTGFYLSACKNGQGTICWCVQIDGVLFVACEKLTGTICPTVFLLINAPGRDAKHNEGASILTLKQQNIFFKIC